MKCILAVCAFAIFISGIPAMFPRQAEAADNELFQQMDIGFFSIGGRAAYYDPNEGQARWFGGAQVRVNPFKYLSFEGSADYRQQDTAGSTIHTYPVQVSALIYPLGTLDWPHFSSVVAGGTTPRSVAQATSMTRKIDSASMLGAASSFSSTTISQSTVPTDTFGWRISSLKTRTSKTRISTTTAT